VDKALRLDRAREGTRDPKIAYIDVRTALWTQTRLRGGWDFLFFSATKASDDAGFILRKPLGYLIKNRRLLKTGYLLCQKLFYRKMLAALAAKSTSGTSRFELTETTLRTIGADLVGL